MKGKKKITKNNHEKDKKHQRNSIILNQNENEKQKKPALVLLSYINWKIYLILIIFILSVSTYARYSQYNYWTHHKAVYFTDGYPAMTTLDAYHWLRYAKEEKSKTYYKHLNDPLVAYPDGSLKPKPIPMLSFIIAKLSSISNLSIYKSGLFIIPLFASLFIIPLTLYFYLVDMPMAGIVGGFVGSFGWMYFLRTSMGRVDTDLLQLFFLFLASLFLMLAYQTKEKRAMLIYSAFTGITLGFFGWWYAHNGIIVVYIVLLVVMLCIKKEKLSLIILSGLILGLFANPIFTYSGLKGFLSFIHNYLSIKQTTTGGFPNILKTITETEHIADSRVLLYMLSSKFLDIFGLAGFLVSIKFLKIRIIPIIPILGLGLMAFTGANRSIMFLAPFVGVGMGFLIDLAISYTKKTYAHFDTIKASSASIAVTALLLFGISKLTAMYFIPKPSIAADIVHSFIQIKHNIKKASIVSWWDYGYAIEDIDGFATYHDGGAHGGARTYFIAKALSSDNQTQLYNIISYIDRFGIKSIDTAIKNGEKTTDVVKKVIAYNKPIKHNFNYLLFTRDMIPKFAAITYLGTWNFKLKKSYPMYFQVLGCNGFKNNTLFCYNVAFNLKKGLINNKIPLQKVIFSENGYVTNEKDYPNNGPILELILKGNKLIYALVCNKRTYETNFNQIYILGRYNKKYFKEVYNNFPSARMFKFLK